MTHTSSPRSERRIVISKAVKRIDSNRPNAPERRELRPSFSRIDTCSLHAHHLFMRTVLVVVAVVGVVAVGGVAVSSVLSGSDREPSRIGQDDSRSSSPGDEFSTDVTQSEEVRTISESELTELLQNLPSGSPSD
jgi:hypothetical protein